MTEPIVRPYQPEKLSAAEARLAVALGRAGRRFAMPLGTAEAHLEVLPLPGALAPEAVLTIDIDGAPWLLALGDLKLLELHAFWSEKEVRGTPPEALPEALLSAVAETLFEPILKTASAKLGIPVLFKSFALTQKGSRFRAALLANLAAGEVRTSLGLSPAESLEESSCDLAARLLTLPSRALPEIPGRIAAVAIELHFVAGTTRLSRVDYTSLEPGDIIIPDEWTPKDGKLSVELSTAGRPQLCAQGELGIGELTLTSPFELFEPDERIQPAEESEETKMENIDALDVTLTFELERRTMTVGELRALEPGHVFTLGLDPAQPVTVLANGTPVARGRIVDLNGTLGVQLTELAEKRSGETSRSQ